MKQLVSKIFNRFNLLLFTLFFIHFSAVPIFLNSLASVGLLLLIGFFIWDLIKGQTGRLFNTGYEKSFLVLLAAILFAALDAFLKERALAAFATMLFSVFVFYMLSGYVKSKVEFKKVQDLFFTGFILMLVIGLIQIVLVRVIGYEKVPLFLEWIISSKGWAYRIPALFIRQSGVNAYAAYLALFVPVIVGLSVVNFKKLPGKIFLLLAALLLNIAYTESRALLVSLVVAGFVTVLFFNIRRKVILTVLVALLGVLFLVAPIRNTFSSLLDKQNDSNSEHINTVIASFERIAKHPINGYGGGNIDVKLKKVDTKWQNVYHQYKSGFKAGEYSPEAFWRVETQAKKDGVILVGRPHNMYLGWILEYGFLGVAAFLYLFFIISKKILFVANNSNKKEVVVLAKSLWSGLIAFMVYGLFQDSINTSLIALFFWLFIWFIYKLESIAAK